MGIKARISEVRELCCDGMLWMRIWKTTPVFAWMKAAKAYRTSNYSKAVECYRRGLSKYPSHPAHFSARYDLAYCLEKMGCYEEAIQELSYIISLKYELKDAYLMRARLLSYIGKYSYALETLRIASSIFKNDVNILSQYLHLLIDVATNYNDLEAVKKDIQNMLLMNVIIDTTQKNEAMTAIAHFESTFGDEIKADQILNKVFTESSENLRANILRGQRLLSNSKIDQAREYFRKAHLIDPSDPIPQILIAESYIASGDKEELIWAIQMCESACRASKWTNPDAIETLINAYQLNSELSKVELFSERLKNIGNYKAILGSKRLSVSGLDK